VPTQTDPVKLREAGLKDLGWINGWKDGEDPRTGSPSEEFTVRTSRTETISINHIGKYFYRAERG